MIDKIRKQILEIDNFPKEGISFKDISQLIKSEYFSHTIKLMSEKVYTIPDYWVGIESRGFIFASALSIIKGGGIVLCRKKNKLPPPVISIDYELEYGRDTLEVKPGTGKVVIVDDVLATGGTMKAVEELIQKAGYEVVDKLVLLNLKFLNAGYQVKSLIDYE